ncbi:hypothetical protein RIF29_41418 [Crotalaria pallida]|uniref:Pectinesterase catalytic domain-containing protein n=1 Tax=Crotalaria pallida TaxID=3830 RepID=A0AAN9E5D8_CROPI
MVQSFPTKSLTSCLRNLDIYQLYWTLLLDKIRVMLLIFVFAAFLICCHGRGRGHHFVPSYNVIVSKDGSGNYTSVDEAIKNAPNMSDTLYHIYITTEIHGAGFNAAYMSFVNGAGLTAGQANAVRNAADNTMFYACSIEGYQDTLYAVKGTQWYENCEIYGTVDFIYGNAAAGFHDCMVYARFREVVTFTAQGREDPTGGTGFLFQRCNFTMSPEDYTKKSQVSARLGRPWRPYSNVIIMGSYIDDMVAPNGWDEWHGVPTDKLTYVEYNNVGPGSNIDGRVKWPGVRAFNNLTEVVLFLLARHSWIPLPWYPH